MCKPFHLELAPQGLLHLFTGELANAKACVKAAAAVYLEHLGAEHPSTKDVGIVLAEIEDALLADGYTNTTAAATGDLLAGASTPAPEGDMASVEAAAKMETESKMDGEPTADAGPETKADS